MLEQRIQQQFFDSADLKYAAAEILSKPIADAVNALVGCVTAGGKVLVCGNGGSAADAQHFAAKFVGRFERERPGLAAVALTTDGSILTAIGNDGEFERVFSKQVQSLGSPGDVLLFRWRDRYPAKHAAIVATAGTMIHAHDGAAGVRRILGILALARTHGPAVVNDAATAALDLGVPTYRFIRRYLDRRPPVPLTLRQVDPLIRQLTLYRDLIDRRTGDSE